MNNKEKNEYLNCLALAGPQCHLNEMQTRNQILSRCPNILYKYRSFDEYTSEMIENGYAYLTPVKDLDDPFDCMNDFDLSELFDPEKGFKKTRLVDYVLKNCDIPIAKEQRPAIRAKALECLNSEGLEPCAMTNAFMQFGLPRRQANNLANLIQNFQNFFDAFENNYSFGKLATTAFAPGDLVGVCSLSEVRDNKIMWSLYSKKYEGYCVEYEIPSIDDARLQLYPVVYSKAASNNFLDCLFKTIFGQAKRQMPSYRILAEPQIEGVGALYRLYCTKDSDWAFQKEWRIVGEPKGHFTHLRIKAIYLGFNASQSNEAKMRTLAERHGFALYKMKAPHGKRRIEFAKINP